MTRNLINVSNLHAGGGVQVATSFISELLAQGTLPQQSAIYASSAVKRNLEATALSQASIAELTTCDVRGLNLFDRLMHSRMNDFDVVFTVFGPLYRWGQPFRSIVGFAQPWIIYPNNECYTMLSPMQRFKTRLKFWLQAMFFKRADQLVVELEHVKDGLIRELGIDPKRIHVVHNCLSAIYGIPNLWQPVDIPLHMDCLKLGFVGRNYLHKNTAIFPEIVDILHRDHGLNARFYVTFTDEEWQACTQSFRDSCVNIGPLTVTQCPTFYKAMDGIVFPSLLECFSATPLEAMAMKIPLFASDRPFNREICAQHAHYFDPLAPETAAKQIASVFDTNRPITGSLQAARDHAITFSSPAKRANAYMALITDNFENLNQTDRS